MNRKYKVSKFNATRDHSRSVQIPYIHTELYIVCRDTNIILLKLTVVVRLYQNIFIDNNL